MSFPFYSPSLIKLKQVHFQISVRQELTPHGSRGEVCDKVCGFQRQRELTTRGLVILRFLRSLREIKRKRGRRRTDAGSESRSKVYFDYAEQQGGKDHKVGLRR